ncbi:CheY-like chemotaxis protein [Mucilaginibacter sp. UYP25]|uniref:hypothetical protein n=1 Tax=unclassified Mucilaginibacter TaxID=2617802 RepID=UPI00339106DA
MNDKILVIEDASTRFSENVSCTKLKYNQQSKDEDIHFWILKNKDLFEGVEKVIIPCRLGADDAEFMGLYLGLHIRLTKELDKFRYLPIIFISEDAKEEILENQINNNKTKSSLLLFTKGTKLISSFDLSDVIQNQIKPIEIEEYYYSFISNIEIPIPENSSDHSITNEWNIYRWFEMIEDYDNQEYKLLSESIYNLKGIHSLYFKYRDELSKQIAHKTHRQTFKKKDKKRLEIQGIIDKKILFIDDEGHKGWNPLLKYIFDNSGAEISFYEKFDKNESQKELVEKLVKEFVITKHIFDYDLLIIDLRLCDDDFKNENIEELSSFIFIKEIARVNKGFQVMFFTASNKSWNIKKAIDLHATDYIVKEAPYQLFDKNQSYLKYVEFGKGVKKCVERSFLSKLRLEIDALKSNNILSSNSPDKIEFTNLVFSNGGLFDELFSVLELDHKALANNALLICFNILENYADLFGAFEGTWMIWDKADRAQLNYSANSSQTLFELKFGFFSDIMQSSNDFDNTLIGVDFYPSLQQRHIDHRKKAKKASPILKIATVLKYRNNIPDVDINKLFRLRFIRNNATAHSGNIKPGIQISVDDVEFLISNIFKAIFF